VPGVLIVRPDETLYYANWRSVRDSIKDMINALPSPPRALILDLSSQYELDYTSTVGLQSLVRELEEQRIDVSFVGLHAPILREDKSGLLAPIFEGHTFPTMDDAVRHAEGAM
jgi:SulP family sulfate permease